MTMNRRGEKDGKRKDVTERISGRERKKIEKGKDEKKEG